MCTIICSQLKLQFKSSLLTVIEFNFKIGSDYLIRSGLLVLNAVQPVRLFTILEILSSSKLQLLP